MADRGWFSRGRSAHTAQKQAQQSNVTLGTRGDAGGQARTASLHRSLTQVPIEQNNQHKAPKLFKISSYISLGTAAKSQSSTAAVYPELIMERSESIKPGAAGHHVTSVDGGGPIGDWQPPPKEEREFPKYKASKCTWENPSLKQMVETVSCTMMKNGSSAPIPRHLNGWIAGMMEEVSHQTRELDSLRVQIADLKATREEEIIAFSKVTEEWAQREKDFKAEINRLEHIISDTQQGAESVMLARAGSVVNRNDGRAFRAKLDRLSRSDEGHGNAREEDDTSDRHQEYLIEQETRSCAALSPGDVGLTMSTTPYNVLGSTPSLLDQNNDIHLSKQLRTATPKRDRKQDQDISAKLVAARVSLETTGKPPAPSAQTSSGSSSQSSSASCSSSPIAQGLAKMAEDKVTPHTSPTKDENLCGRPVEESKKDRDVLMKIRQLAAQNGGLPDDAVGEGSCLSSIVDLRGRREFSFSTGDGNFVSQDQATLSVAKPSTEVDSNSRRPLQLSSAAEEQPHDSQYDGAARFSGRIVSNASGLQQSSSSSSSSDTSQRRGRESMLRTMGRNHATKANEEKAAADELKKLEVASACSPMIVAMARERSVPSPSKKVQESQVPRAGRLTRLGNPQDPQGRAFTSDEEPALVPNSQANDQPQVRSQGHRVARATPRAAKPLSTEVACNQEAAAAAAMALKSSTSGQNVQNESNAQAA